jgi:hypothetical protein
MMAARLDDATADRLVKVLGMLGSDHAGERAAAGAKAAALVKAAGMTWRDVIAPSPPIIPQLENPTPDWRRMAAECHARRARLKPSELAFVAKIITWRGEPTEKQLAWLEDIHARLHDGGRQ